MVCCSGSNPSCLLHSEPRSGTTLANCSLHLSPFHSLPSTVQGPPFAVCPQQSHGLSSSSVCLCVGLIGQRTEREIKVMGTGPVLMGPQSLGSERWFPGLGVVCAVQPWLPSWHCRIAVLPRGWAGRNGGEKRKKEKAQRAPQHTFMVPSPTPWTWDRGSSRNSACLYLMGTSEPPFRTGRTEGDGNSLWSSEKLRCQISFPNPPSIVYFSNLQIAAPCVIRMIYSWVQ